MKQIKSAKRKLMIPAVALSAVMALACGIPYLPSRQTADAAVIRKEGFSDNFNGQELSEDWTNPVNAQLNVKEFSLRYSGINNVWGSCIGLTKYQITDSVEITFDMEVSGSGWVALVFGMPKFNSVIDYGDTGTWFFADCSRLIDDHKGEKSVLDAATMDSYATYSATPFTLNRASFKYVITKTENVRETDHAKLYDIDVYLYESGSELPEQPMSWKGVELDGYLGFSTMGEVDLSLFDFEISHNDEKVFSDDFKEGGFLFDGELNIGQNWSIKYFDPSVVEIGAMADIVVTTGAESGYIESTYSIERDRKVEKQLDVSLSVKLGEMSLQTVFGMGLNALDETVVGLEKVDGKTYRAVFVKDGKVVGSSQPQTVEDGGFIPIQITGYYDDRVEIEANGVTFTLNGGDFSGKFTLGAYRIGEETVQSGRVFFDDVALNVYRYEFADSDDSAINFKGVKSYEDAGEILYEYYVNRTDWHMSGVQIPLYSAAQNRNYVQISSGNENTVFGPKKQYSEFICRFTVTVTDDNATPETAIVLSFGRKNLYDAATVVPGVFFTNKKTGMSVEGRNVTGNSVAVDGISFWDNRDENNGFVSYDIMVIVLEGRIEVFLAPHGDESGEMSILRASFACDDTKGYVAVSGLNSASFRINRFSITNINSER